VLSLTVVRMLPVALSLLGAGFDRLSVAFIGWFGPRGLASVIFALLALEDLHDAAEEVVATIALTVLLSVVAHGFSAQPFAGRFTMQAEPPARNSGRSSTGTRSGRNADREGRHPGDGPDR
jgi:NhaP-type Na+/H+ or K+/H+ antiporter